MSYRCSWNTSQTFCVLGQQRSSHTEINLISDDEDDFEIQEIGAGNVASERDKNSLDSSSMVTHARGGTNSSRDPTGTPGKTLPTTVSTRNETSVPLIGKVHLSYY